MKRGSCFLVGFVLLILGGLALKHSFKAGISQWHYYQGKYGSDRGDIRQFQLRCHKAIRYYPHHYRLCMYAAEETLREAEMPGTTNATEWLQTSRFWCERGLALNNYPTTLRWVKATLLSKEDPEQAALYWKKYTEWHFWEPYNHAFLAKLYAKAGLFHEAEDELGWVGKGSPYYAEAYAVLTKAQQNAPSKAVPPESSSPEGQW